MKLLVFCPNWIGDAVMATPTLRAIRRLHPSATIHGLIRPYVAETLSGNPWFDGVIHYDHKSTDPSLRTLSVLRRIREERYDVGVLLTNSVRTALLAWAGGVRRRVGYARDARRLLLNDPLPIRRGRNGYEPSPVIDYYLDLAYHLGAPPESYEMELFTDADSERRATLLWKKFGFSPADRVVALNPGSRFGPSKRWPSLSFAQLAGRLCVTPGIRVLVLCGPHEKGLAQYISDASLHPRLVKSLAEEEVSIGLTKSVLRRCSLLVSTDSGPRHIAAAFNTPVVSLFGPTHIEWTETYFPKEIKLQQKLECGPCQQRTCPLEHQRCMKELTVDMVHAAVLRQLGQPLRPREKSA